MRGPLAAAPRRNLHSCGPAVPGMTLNWPQLHADVSDRSNGTANAEANRCADASELARALGKTEAAWATGLPAPLWFSLYGFCREDLRLRKKRSEA